MSGQNDKPVMPDDRGRPDANYRCLRAMGAKTEMVPHPETGTEEEVVMIEGPEGARVAFFPDGRVETLDEDMCPLAAGMLTQAELLD